MQIYPNSFLRILLVIILLLCQIVYTQNNSYKFERFTINNGLSNNSVNCVLQTHDGYLWIATKDGLNRFDGQTFKVFKKNASQKNSLPENYIMHLYEDRKHILWIGTWGVGLCRYDPIQEEFIRVDKSNNNDFVQSIVEDTDGNLWYGTTLNGLKKYNPITNEIVTYNSKSEKNKRIPADNVTSTFFQNKNTLWISTWGSGIFKINTITNEFEQYKRNSEKNSISDDLVWSIGKTNDNSLYICTNRGLDLLDTQNNSFTKHPNIKEENHKLLTTSVRFALTDHVGRIWIGTYNYQGLVILSKKENNEYTFEHLLNRDDDPYSLICQRIRWIYEDKQKNIWFGTEDGLNKLPKTKEFEQYTYMPNRSNSLGGRVVSSIYEGKNKTLWVGFGGNGFDKIDLITNHITHFKSNAQNENTLSANDVITLIEDKEGTIWLGTSNGGLNRYNPKTNSFKSYMVNSTNLFSIKSNWVQQVLETSDGNLLVGTNDGLQTFDRRSERFEAYKPIVNTKEVLIPDLFSVNSLYEDKQKNIWIGTWLDGLYRYDPAEKRITHYSPKTQQNTISGNKISSIIQDQKGNIWIGTFSNGLNKMDKYKNKFSYYNTSNGLPNDCVFGILEDENGLIWISTMKGLAKLNPVDGNIRVYDIEDGLVNNQFNWHAYHKNAQGKMYFGGINGFVSFFPSSIKKESETPNVVLTSFKVFDKEAPLPRSLPTTNEINLSHDQNFFSIDFTALDLTPMYKHQFAYMLEGLDPQWVLSGTRTTAFYTDIKHGYYRFLVKATNADGVWGNPTSISILINPAWWNTWWFKVITIGFIISLIFAGYRYRVTQLLKIEKIRFSIASDLHDEIGSNLSSISVDSQSLMSSTTLNNSERELSIDISKTAKATVDAMRDIIWFINPKNDVNEDIIFKMKQTAAKLLSNLEWSFNASPDARIDSFNLEVRRNIFLLYKEALTNVVHHSKAVKCDITISRNSKNFCLSIVDNGVGFELKDFKSSTGIRSMEARAKKMNSKLNISSSINQGTRIELVI